MQDFIRGQTNDVRIEGLFDTHNNLDLANALAATGSVTMYSDAAGSSAVSGASNLAIRPFPNLKAFPVRYYATVPHSITLTANTVYYIIGSLTMTDRDGVSCVKRVYVEVTAKS